MPKTTPLEWIERYDVPSAKSDAGWVEGWATIHIDSSGFLGIVSDFGNYAYAWGAFGSDFKAFLSRVDWDQLHSKLMSGKDRFVYDPDATRKAVEKAIAEQRDDVDEDRELDLLEDADLYDADGFDEWVTDTRLDDPWELRQTTHEPQCRRFCQETWPRFLELLKAGHCSPILPSHVAVAPVDGPATRG